MAALDEVIDERALADWLALACAAANGAALAIIDPTGRRIAGLPVGEDAPLAHPILVGGRVVASLGTASSVPPELVALLARSLELMLGGAREAAERVRAGQELAIGRRIQRSLLPRSFPDVQGWTFAAEYEPAREVGGDLFDTFLVRRQPGVVALLIADVTGKGIPAALLMADVRALLHAATDNADGPADALGRVNRILVHEREPSLFVTAALLVLDATTGELRFASAGHEPPLVARAGGGIDRLDAPGPILGAFGDAEFAERSAALGPGDALILYTDGVTEARNEARAFFGEDRLLATVDASGGGTAGEIRDAIVADVAAFRGSAEPFDDLTLLVVGRSRPGGA